MEILVLGAKLVAKLRIIRQHFCSRAHVSVVAAAAARWQQEQERRRPTTLYAKVKLVHMLQFLRVKPTSVWLDNIMAY